MNVIEKGNESLEPFFDATKLLGGIVDEAKAAQMPKDWEEMRARKAEFYETMQKHVTSDSKKHYIGIPSQVSFVGAAIPTVSYTHPVMYLTIHSFFFERRRPRLSMFFL